MPPAISHVLETCLYVKSITTSVDFYQKLLGVKPFLKTVNPPFSPFNCLPSDSLPPLFAFNTRLPTNHLCFALNSV